MQHPLSLSLSLSFLTSLSLHLTFPLYTFIPLYSHIAPSLVSLSASLSLSELVWSLPVGVYVGEDALQPAGLCIYVKWVLYFSRDQQAASSVFVCACVCMPFYFQQMKADRVQTQQNHTTEDTAARNPQMYIRILLHESHQVLSHSNDQTYLHDTHKIIWCSNKQLKLFINGESYTQAILHKRDILLNYYVFI